jgi:hypothetical protein
MTAECSRPNLVLPVYQVTGSGVDRPAAEKLAESLGIPGKELVLRDGTISYVDPARYLRVPTVAVEDKDVVAGLRDRTTNYFPERPIEVTAIDYSALAGMEPLGVEEALDRTAKALSSAGLAPRAATPVPGHTVFRTVPAGDNSRLPAATTTFLDTHVSHRFTLDGYLLVGPGAQVQVSYDPDGVVTRLVHTTWDLVAGPSVEVLDADAVRDRYASLLRGGAEVDLRLVYWAPPLRPGISSSPRSQTSVIIPWYAVSITRPAVVSTDRDPVSISSRVHLIPATDDPRYVPSVDLTVKAAEESLVEGRACAHGGTPPYRYLWAGSNPEASSGFGPTVSYVPVTRDIREVSANQSLRKREQVSLTVLDANGVPAVAAASILVTAQPAPVTHSSVTYGCESPNDPGPSAGDGTYAPERIAWQQAMGLPGQGGGNQRFCWLADDSWPGDFIEPPKPGALESSPWINGDADYRNWGINTTNIVLYNGDGAPTGFAEMYPGATKDDYNTGSGGAVNSPGSGFETVYIGSQGYSVNYNGSWGAPHPHDNLQWLVMYACQVLENDSGSADPWDQWGPAFNGLHSLLGFETNASDNGVGFMTDFPQSMLGLDIPLFGLPAHTVVQAWLSSALANNMGTPAALGSIMDIDILDITFGISDYGDYYWGKGAVGPTIPRSAISGWWYIQGTDAVQEFP